jgi:hypothetical protein
VADSDNVVGASSGVMGRGVLRPDLAEGRFGLVRLVPSAPLAPFVDYYWIVRWDLRGQPAHEQTILPHPNVHLVFEASGAGIYGVDRSLFTRRLSGQGKALGVRFRAGCFRPFWGAPIAQLSDRVVPAARLFGPLAEKTRQAVMCADTDADMVGGAESLLFSALPDRDPIAEQAAGVVALIGVPPRRYAAAPLRCRAVTPLPGRCAGSPLPAGGCGHSRGRPGSWPALRPAVSGSGWA